MEACFRQWKHSLYSILRECFPQEKLISDKQVYSKEIRQHIKDRKELSRHDISKSRYQYHISIKLKREMNRLTLKLLTIIVKLLDRKLAGMGPSVSRISGKLKETCLLPIILSPFLSY